MPQIHYKLIVKKIKIEESKDFQVIDFQELQKYVPENHRLLQDTIKYHVFANEVVVTFEAFPMQK